MLIDGRPHQLTVSQRGSDAVARVGRWEVVVESDWHWQGGRGVPERKDGETAERVEGRGDGRVEQEHTTGRAECTARVEQVPLSFYSRWPGSTQWLGSVMAASAI